MRIVGGRWRGRPLRAPQGRGTRPTRDQVREALASMVVSAFDLDLSDATILDPFAGSGALSLELLSRGARRATLVERDARALAAIRANVDALDADRLVDVVRGDVLSPAVRPHLGRDHGIVLLDPPYAMEPGRLTALLVELVGEGVLAPGPVVVHERAREAPTLPADAMARMGLSLSSSRPFGSTALDLWTAKPHAGEGVSDRSRTGLGRGGAMSAKGDGITHVVVPGSFDPVTLGHIDVITRARRLSPQVTVAVAASEGKRGVGTSFTLGERIALVRESLVEAGLDDVAVVGLRGLLVDLCHELGAQAVVKGLRAATDFEYELQQAALNQSMAADIESVFIMSRPDFSYVSSSIVREIAALGGDVSPFVPPCVAARLAERFAPQVDTPQVPVDKSDSC